MILRPTEFRYQHSAMFATTTHRLIIIAWGCPNHTVGWVMVVSLARTTKRQGVLLQHRNPWILSHMEISDIVSNPSQLSSIRSNPLEDYEPLPSPQEWITLNSSRADLVDRLPIFDLVIQPKQSSNRVLALGSRQSNIGGPFFHRNHRIKDRNILSKCSHFLSDNPGSYTEST